MKVQILENVEEAIGERIYDFIKQISKLFLSNAIIKQ